MWCVCVYLCTSMVTLCGEGSSSRDHHHLLVYLWCCRTDRCSAMALLQSLFLSLELFWLLTVVNPVCFRQHSPCNLFIELTDLVCFQCACGGSMVRKTYRSNVYLIHTWCVLSLLLLLSSYICLPDEYIGTKEVLLLKIVLANTGSLLVQITVGPILPIPVFYSAISAFFADEPASWT